MKFNIIFFVITISLFYTNIASAIDQKDLVIDQKQFVTDITEVKSIAQGGDLNKAIELWLSKKDLYANAGGHYEYELGVLYHSSNDYNKAEVSYKKGIKVTNKYPRLYTGLVFTYMAQEKTDAARFWATKAVTDYPRWPHAHTAMASIEIHLKNYKLAIKSAQKSISLKDSALAHYIIGA